MRVVLDPCCAPSYVQTVDVDIQRRAHYVVDRISACVPYYGLCSFDKERYMEGSVFCPGFQKGRVPSEKGTLAR